MSGRLIDIIARGLRAAQPSLPSSDAVPGSLYFVTDESVTERVSDDGTTWEDYTDSGGAGSGTVTNTGTLTANLPVVGNGGVDVKILAAGTALQVLRMNAGATAVEFATVSGTGDVVGPAASVDKEIALFDGTTGKLLERATGTGYVKVASGVMGTPAAGVPIATDVSGLGTGVATALAVNVGSAGAPVVFNGALGTPSSGTGTNITGLPLTTGVTGTLPIANGGTANTTATAAFDALAPTTTAGDVIFHNGSDNVRLGIGTALQVLRTNAGATAPEWATAAAGDVTASGTLTANRLILGGGTTVVTAAASLGTTTTVLHGNAAGAPTFGAVDLAADVTGDLPFANLTQGSALSVLGVTGNSTADNASIAAASDHQVMRRSGTAVAFGAVNLAQSAAVTGTLPSANLPTAVVTKAIGVTIDGGGSPITTGIKADIYIPFAFTVTAVTMLADTSTTSVIDLWADSYTNYPPTDADSITSATPPTITATIKSQDTSLASWIVSFVAGTTLRVNVDSNNNATRINLTLTVTT